MPDDPRHLPHRYRDAQHSAQTEIGLVLRSYYEVPKDIPDAMRALLAQLDQWQERE